MKRKFTAGRTVIGGITTTNDALIFLTATPTGYERDEAFPLTASP